MLEPSLKRTPSLWVLLTPSEPAKSTRFTCEVLMVFLEVCKFFSESKILSLKTVCEREDFSFNLVSAIFLYSSPLSKYCMASSGEWISNSLNPSTMGLPYWFSLTLRFFLVGSSKSFTHSLYISM